MIDWNKVFYKAPEKKKVEDFVKEFLCCGKDKGLFIEWDQAALCRLREKILKE